MATISSAISDEEELERMQNDRKRKMAAGSQGRGGPKSVLQGGETPGYAPVPVPKRKR